MVLDQQEVIKKNKILCEHYPFLIPTRWNLDTMQYEIPKDYDYTYTELDALPKGWAKAFGEMFCEELREELIKFNALNDYRVEQAKEKYGSMRWYDNGTPIGCNTNEIIDKYSTLSENICAICGKPDVPVTGYSWFYPLCKTCYCTPTEFYKDRLNSEAVKEFWDEHEKDWNMWCDERGCVMADEYTMKSWSKENGEKTTTYNISETANKIRAKWRVEHGK